MSDEVVKSENSDKFPATEQQVDGFFKGDTDWKPVCDYSREGGVEEFLEQRADKLTEQSYKGARATTWNKITELLKDRSPVETVDDAMDQLDQLDGLSTVTRYDVRRDIGGGRQKVFLVPEVGADSSATADARRELIQTLELKIVKSDGAKEIARMQALERVLRERWGGGDEDE